MPNDATMTSNPLISSDRVEGTTVYNTAGDKIGHIDNLILDKRSGKVAYAVMSFGGFLGIGEEYHPLPWQSLDYDERQEGYVVDISEDQLRKAPTLKRTEYDRLRDDAYGRSVYSYYGAAPFWY